MVVAAMLPNSAVGLLQFLPKPCSCVQAALTPAALLVVLPLGTCSYHGSPHPVESNVSVLLEVAVVVKIESA